MMNHSFPVDGAECVIEMDQDEHGVPHFTLSLAKTGESLVSGPSSKALAKQALASGASVVRHAYHLWFER